jgi:hypothetical protein
MKQKKHTISYDAEIEFEVLAICSPYPDFRFIWNINKAAELQMTKAEIPFHLYNKKGELSSSHSKYYWHDDSNEVQYMILKNFEQGKRLVPELDQVDYFLFVQTDYNTPTKDILKALTRCEAVMTAFEVNVEDYPFFGLVQELS